MIEIYKLPKHYQALIFAIAILLFSIIFSIADCGLDMECWRLKVHRKMIIGAFGVMVVVMIISLLIELVLLIKNGTHEL